jgi:hypothetical protein
MSTLQSNADALLVAIPMIGILVVGFFRLDELVGKPNKRQIVHRRQIAGLDDKGRQVCLDPDGTIQAGRKSARLARKKR